MDPAVFGYIRVSQAEGESGLATQRRILNNHGLRDDRIFTDVASGRNMRRPSWQSLHRLLKPGDTVVVPRIDRLARNLTEGLKNIEELHGQGINIRSLAEWERDTIRDRRQAACAVAGEGGSRQELLGQRRNGKRRRQDVRGESAHRARRKELLECPHVRCGVTKAKINCP